MPEQVPSNTPESQPRNPFGMALGIALTMAGVAVIFAQNRGVIPSGDLTMYGGLGLLLAGGSSFWLSGLPKDKVIEWLKSAGFALALALTIRWAIAEPYRIPSSSMEPTLIGKPGFFEGDRVFVNKFAYGVRWPFMNSRIWYGTDPQRWDIVVFKSVEEDAAHPTLVKRIVGMPGERIQIRGGSVYVDGEVLEIPDFLPPDLQYTSAGAGFTRMKYGVRAEDEFSVVPEGHYLVLGDNSAQSRDGRFFGWLPNEHIVGRVASIWWPIGHWRDFTGFSQTLWWRGLMVLLAVLTFVRLFIGQSWPVVMDEGGKVRHLFVSFASLGLRIPFIVRWVVQWGEPKRGDLMLYRAKHESIPPDALLFGRIAGLPGEKVLIENGELHVNGHPLESGAWPDGEPLGDLGPEAKFAIKRKHSAVPEGHYFLLADPPGEKDVIDSRVIGWIPKQDLLGQAVAIWWPLSARKKI